MKIQGYISSSAFWDANFNELDFYQNQQFIITRVFNYGKWKDIIRVIEVYGDETVIKVLTSTDNLTELGLHMASSIFKIDKTQFTCYKTNNIVLPRLDIRKYNGH